MNYREGIDNLRMLYAILGEFLDILRVFPRMFLIAYAYILYDVINWFMRLKEPTTTDTIFVSIVVGISSVVIGLYQSSGINREKYKFQFWHKKDINSEDQ